MGTPQSIVSDRYFAYQMPVKTLHGVRHIRVECFHDNITNDLISIHFHVHLFQQLHPPTFRLEQPYSGAVSRSQAIPKTQTGASARCVEILADFGS